MRKGKQKAWIIGLGILIAIFILSNLSYTIGYGLSSQLPGDELKNKNHVTLFTDLMQVAAKSMLNTSKIKN